MSNGESSSPAHMLVGPEGRGQETFGGVVPTAAVARGGETVVAALVVEHHADGAAIPLLALSEAPGVLGLDPEASITAVDDTGRAYEVLTVERDAGLGAVQATLWIAPAIPADARRLTIEVRELTRTSANRRGAAERALSGGPWVLDLDLLPERTAAVVPARGGEVPPPAEAAGAPARAAASFAGLVPIGQARMGAGLAVCVWALERYGDRAVLTMGTLGGEGVEVRELTPGRGRVQVWDDSGTRYEAMPIHGSATARWSETSLEITPAPPADARSLGVRISDLPGVAVRPEGRGALEGPYEFGVALPGSPQTSAA